ncbi:MAG TPA: LuxR C-terminal-related transcriptional regulator [Candidatus Baltobacteraceae bacterium]|nr:LuxR C-terminal-related transcriptional regulator [Candidatus Baltobacteraceae bacterium]
MNFRNRSRLAMIASDDASSAAVRAVEVGLRSRITVVAAVAGWGKSTAVRKALRDTEHVWLDLSPNGLVPGLCAGNDWSGGTVVVDGAHLLREDELDALLDATMRLASTRWIIITRRLDRLPIARWIASGDAGAPVVHEDLGLSQPEILAAAKALSVRVDDAAMQFVEAVSGGWPVAVRFALIALERWGGDLSRAGAMTNTLLRDWALSEILPALTTRQRELLLEVAMIGTIDETSHELRSAPVPWLAVGDRLALHSAFQRIVLAEIPQPERRSRALRAASVLRSRGDLRQAFDLVRQHAPERIHGELRAHGLALLEAGEWDNVEGAIRGLPQRERHDDPLILCLRAEIEAQAGAPQRARVLFERAALLAQGEDTQSIVSRRHALFLINQGSIEALDAIRPAMQTGSENEKAEALSVFATALALAGKAGEARHECRRALDAAIEMDDDALVTRCLQRMSYVEYQAGDIAEAERYALDTTRLAYRIGAWSHFVCAHSILFASAIGARDDHAGALWHAQQLALGAQHTRDRRHWLQALGSQFVLEVERGNRERTIAIESQMPQHLSGWRAEVDVCLARCIRRCWDGEFEQALGELDRHGNAVADPSEHRLWNAARAMLAAFAGRDRIAFKYLRACARAPSSFAREGEIHNGRADCYAAVAQVFLGHPEAATRRLPRDPSTLQLRALTSFVRELAALGFSLGRESASAALDRLRDGGQGGFALAAEIALAARTRDDRAGALTAAELEVLADMARGRTAKNIAFERGRSPHTVRNQIKAIIKKLGASGSIEAVAMARNCSLID